MYSVFTLRTNAYMTGITHWCFHKHKYCLSCLFRNQECIRMFLRMTQKPARILYTFKMTRASWFRFSTYTSLLRGYLSTKRYIYTYIYTYIHTPSAQCIYIQTWIYIYIYTICIYKYVHIIHSLFGLSRAFRVGDPRQESAWGPFRSGRVARRLLHM